MQLFFGLYLTRSRNRVFSVRPTMTETTALGAAIAAGCADGINVWDINKVQPAPSDVFQPLMSEKGKILVIFNVIKITATKTFF